MTTGIATADANGWLDAFLSSVTYSEPAALWLKLHGGDPGPSGLLNAAANTTRQQAVFNSSIAGVASIGADIVWSSVPAQEQYTHLSFWDDPTAGTFRGSATLTTPATVTVNDNFRIPGGSFTATLVVLAA